MKLQFAFQGGGAKLVPLVAAAHAVRITSSKHSFRIARVAGTSAGSIAALMLALDIDPVLFKQHLITVCEKYFDRILKRLTLPRVAVKSLIGRPIFDDNEYRDFLEELFTIGGVAYNHLSQAAEKGTQICVYATDIRNAVPKTFDGSHKEHNIVDAIFASSAIPFIFNTYKFGGIHVDGGLLNNFPVGELLLRKDELGDVLGFSFQPAPTYKFNKGLLNYAGAMLGTVIDHSVKSSIAALPAANVHFIDTELGMMQFEEALKELKSKKTYDDYVDRAATFIAKYLAECSPVIRIGDRPAPPIQSEQRRIPEERKDSIIRSFCDYHLALKLKSRYKVSKLSFTYTCRTLRDRKADTELPADEVAVKEEITVLNEPILVYGSTFLSNEKLYDPRNISFRVRKKVGAGRKIEVTTVALPQEYSSDAGGSRHSNVMVFLHEPIYPGQGNDNEWEFSYRTGSDEPLSYLATTFAEDSIQYKNTKDSEIDLLEFVCFIPDDLPEVLLADLPERQRDRNIGWVTGRMLTADELSEHDVPPGGFKAIGWRATRVPAGAGAGFLAYLPSGALVGAVSLA